MSYAASAGAAVVSAAVPLVGAPPVATGRVSASERLLAAVHRLREDAVEPGSVLYGRRGVAQGDFATMHGLRKTVYQGR